MTFKEPTIYYHKKFDRPDVGIGQGRELITVDYNTGWVEYFQREQDLYFSSTISTEVAEKFYHDTVVPRLQDYLKDQDSAAIGLLYKLMQDRRKEPFTLPVFAALDETGPVLSCGGSRFAAVFLTGNSTTDMPVIWQVPKDQLPPDKSAVKIKSTLHFEELCNLQEVQYRIGFNSTGSVPKVSNSSLIDSEYDLAAGNTKNDLINEGNSSFEFWQRFRDSETGKIKISVSCEEENQHLIQYDPDLWSVELTELEIPDFSFVRILEKFATNSAEHKLRLELRGLTQPFWLEFLIPIARQDQVWYYTQDSRLCLYDNSLGPASATCPIGILANFVK